MIIRKTQRQKLKIIPQQILQAVNKLKSSKYLNNYHPRNLKLKWILNNLIVIILVFLMVLMIKIRFNPLRNPNMKKKKLHSNNMAMKVILILAAINMVLVIMPVHL